MELTAKQLYKKQWYEANKERILAKNKERYLADPAGHMEKVKAYRKTEAGKATRKKESAKYRTTEAGRIAHLESERRRVAAIKQQSILVDDEWNDLVIDEVYKLTQTRTKETGLDWHTDHIVPLQGVEVRGLHVWYNLRVVPATINRVKANKL